MHPSVRLVKLVSKIWASSETEIFRDTFLSFALTANDSLSSMFSIGFFFKVDNFAGMIYNTQNSLKTYYVT